MSTPPKSVTVRKVAFHRVPAPRPQSGQAGKSQTAGCKQGTILQSAATAGAGRLPAQIVSPAQPPMPSKSMMPAIAARSGPAQSAHPRRENKGSEAPTALGMIGLESQGILVSSSVTGQVCGVSRWSISRAAAATRSPRRRSSSRASGTAAEAQRLEHESLLGPVGDADPEEGDVEHAQRRECPCQSILLGRTPAANGPGSGQGRDPERGKSRIRQSQKYVDESPPLGNRQVVDAEPHGIPPIPARQ